MYAVIIFCLFLNMVAAGQEFTAIPGMVVGQFMEHESCHEANNRVRNLHGGPAKVQAMWDSPRGLAILIEAPGKGLALSDVAAIIPVKSRGIAFDTYMIKGQQWWNDCPLYSLDELAAYANGTDYYLATGKMAEAKFSLDRGDELYDYSYYSWRKARSVHGYDDRQLKLALTYYHARLSRLRQRIGK
jgi:hypothetical protein